MIVGGNGSGDLLSDDGKPAPQRGDAVLLRRALSEGWNVPAELKANAVDAMRFALKEALAQKSPRLIAACVRTLAVLDAADLKRVEIALRAQGDAVIADAIRSRPTSGDVEQNFRTALARLVTQAQRDDDVAVFDADGNGDGGA